MTWTAPEIEATLRVACAEKGWSFPASCKTLRLAIMGRPSGPSIFEAMEILGKDECFDRMFSYGMARHELPRLR